MANKKELISAESKLFIKQLSGGLYEVEQFVYISEDINYVAKDIIDLDDFDEDHIAYSLFSHGYEGKTDRKFAALAVFQEACQNGEYSPH